MAVGGGAGLGRMPQVGGGRVGLGWESEEVFAICVSCVCVCVCVCVAPYLRTGEWNNVNKVFAA